MTVQDQYPNRFYACYDIAAPQPAPVTGWIDVWGMSDTSSVPDVEDLVPLTEAQWSERTPSGQGVENGKIVAYTPAAPTLSVRAQSALTEAQAITWARFGSLGVTVSQDWIAYQTALLAIVNGKDTSSTVLPVMPS